MEEKLRLHLGCGRIVLKGWVNIDEYSRADFKEDITTLPSFKPGTVDEIYTCHVIEHLTPSHFRRALDRWYDLLKIDGLLIIRVPDVSWHIKNWLDASDEEKYADVGLRDSILGYQSKEREGYHNRNLFTRGVLLKYFESTGFEVLEHRNVTGRNIYLMNDLSKHKRDEGKIYPHLPLKDIWCKAIKG